MSRLVARDEVDAVVVAAGSGDRMGLGPKTWLTLGGRTLLERAVGLTRLVAARTVVGVAAEDVDRARALLPEDTVIVQGGATRRDTTLAAFEAGCAPLVLLHDVAHPFVTSALMHAVIEAAAAQGAAVAVVRSHEGGYHQAPGRPLVRLEPGEVWLMRRPFVLRRAAFARGLETGSRHDGLNVILGRGGVDTQLVPAPPWNIKLTTPEDWALALAIEDGLRPV